MSHFDTIKDINGKIYLSLENHEREKGNSVGNKPEDFEILSFIGSGYFGKVFKVRSKLNKEIYAMKKMDLVRLKSEGQEYVNKALNETDFLLNLSHPHVIKYYNHFRSEDNDFLYIITEYVQNGDLDMFTKSHQRFNKHIPEEELWAIFLQCMEALNYVHSEYVIHRDIKPENIFLGNNFTIKLGDFGVSAVKAEKGLTRLYKNGDYNSLRTNKKVQYSGTFVGTKGYQSKELLEAKDYDQRVDIYAMGVSFFEMCYFHKPNEPICNYDEYGNEIVIFEPIEYYDDENVPYSTELLNIIKLMLGEDLKKMKNSEYYLTLFREGFSKKYLLNTSLNSTIKCLSTFKDITNYYLNIKIDSLNIQNKPVIKAFKECLKYSSGNNFDKKITDFRLTLCTENPRLEKTKEIDPSLILSFIIENLINEDEKKEINVDKSNEHYIISKKEESITSKIDMLLNFNKKFSKKFNSNIIKKFFGLIKNTYFCSECKMKSYIFSGYFFLNFDLVKILKEDDYKNLSSFDLEKYFEKEKIKQRIIEKYCKKCLKREDHGYFNQIYTVPEVLIMSIKRGINYEKKIPVLFPEKLSVDYFVDSHGDKIFKLNGIVGRNNGKFFSIVNEVQQWFRYEGSCSKKMKINSPKIDEKNEEVIMLFYELIK